MPCNPLHGGGRKQYGEHMTGWQGGRLTAAKAGPTAARQKPFLPVTRRMYDALVWDIACDIVGGAIAPGQLLPPEPEVSRTYGVSRTVVREALRVLSSKGLVTVEHGRGTRVNDRDEWHVLDPLLLRARAETGRLHELLAELKEFRGMYECDVAGLAALRRTNEELAQMREALELMIASEGRLAEYEEADARFHEALVKASHNRLLLGIYRTVAELILVGFEAGAWTINVGERITQHKKLYEAIGDGDAAAARQAAQSIIDAFDTQQAPKSKRARSERAYEDERLRPARAGAK